MVIIGIDAHKRSHTAVIVDPLGRQMAVKTIGTTSSDHLALLAWANERDDQERLWAIEDCRHLSRRLERDLLAAGEQVVRVPPKLMALPATAPGRSESQIRSTHSRSPVQPCARQICPLPASRASNARSVSWSTTARTSSPNEPASSAGSGGTCTSSTPHGRRRPSSKGPARSHASSHTWQASLGSSPTSPDGSSSHLRRLTQEIDDLAAELARRITAVAPTLLAIVGCGPLTAAKILGETAGVARFRSKDAYARHNGTAPLPVWSSNKARHQLSRTGNRQLNAAIHRIALTQARCHPGARELLARRKAGGDGGMEALRVLKRRLSDVVYRALVIDQESPAASTLILAA